MRVAQSRKMPSCSASALATQQRAAAIGERQRTASEAERRLDDQYDIACQSTGTNVVSAARGALIHCAERRPASRESSGSQSRAEHGARRRGRRRRGLAQHT